MLSTYSLHRPRKINSVLAPHGYKFERGKIVELDAVATDKDQSENGEKAKTSAKTTKKAPKIF
jgi:hypothetical protein